jgi:peptide-methionine (R)-S-oxide reductase
MQPRNAHFPIKIGTITATVSTAQFVSALFSSDTRFESGTGWPSFWQPIAKENVRQSTDFSLNMIPTADSCRFGVAQLGQLFDDGPKPTGLCFCMNSPALHFVKFSSP